MKNSVKIGSLLLIISFFMGGLLLHLWSGSDETPATSTEALTSPRFGMARAVF